jgi:hypothetical protein
MGISQQKWQTIAGVVAGIGAILVTLKDIIIQLFKKTPPAE